MTTSGDRDLAGPTLGERGASCKRCGALLAQDQRYCLACGERRAGARLPFLEILAEQTGTAAQATPAPARSSGPPRRSARDRVAGNNAAAVAGVACLLLAIGLGYLVGTSGSSDSTAARPPQPIIVQGGGAAPATAPTAAPGAGEATTDTTDGGSSSSADGASETTTATRPSSRSDAKGTTTKATNKALSDLATKSGADYAKQADKLPNEVGTGGKAPPKDDKPAAGGGAFKDFE